MRVYSATHSILLAFSSPFTRLFSPNTNEFAFHSRLTRLFACHGIDKRYKHDIERAARGSLRATQNEVAGRMRPAGRQLGVPVVVFVCPLD